MTYNLYQKKGEVVSLLLTAVAEPFFFHPFIIWSAIKGNIDLLRKKNSWGEMTRLGFSGTQQRNVTAFKPEYAALIATSSDSKEATTAEQATIHTIAEEKATFWYRLKMGIQEGAVYTVLLMIALALTKMYELVRDIQLFGRPQFLNNVFGIGFLNELAFVLNIAIFPSFIFILVYLLHKKTARFLFILFSVLLVFIQFALS